MPYALRMIPVRGGLAPAYQPGDPIEPHVIESWELTEGEDFAAERPDPDAGPQPLPRPADDTDRGAWVAYAISNGTDPDEARGMELDDLMAVEHAEPAADPQRPADSAKKADWVDYAVRRGADETWARADSTTKSDLQAWEPQVGDPLAVAATEQANG